MITLHPENVATLLVVGGLVTLLLRHVLVWRAEGGRRHLPWVLISATGIAYGVAQIAHLSTDDPGLALVLARAKVGVALLLMPLGLAAIETLTERPPSATTRRLGVATLALAIIAAATPWFIGAPAEPRADAFGHRFWIGPHGPAVLALAALVAWTGIHAYVLLRALPAEVKTTRGWLRLAVVLFILVAIHDVLVDGGLRSFHLFAFGYLVFAVVATQFETARAAALRASLAARLAEKREALDAKEASLDRAHAELAQTHQRLVRADRMAALGTLAAGTAHEINNPLTFVMGNAEMLGEAVAELAQQLPPGATDEAQAMLRDIGVGTERIQRVVKQLQALTRDDAAAAGPVDVQALVEVSLAMADHHLKHRARVVRDFAAVPAVFASAARLGQVFLNLIVNAAQAIPPGAADANQVRVTIRAVGERVQIAVADTGTGMPPEVRARIFDPFFSTRDGGPGTGLGLSISLGIVEELGGTIEVDSTPGHGTTVRVELPALPAAPEVARPAAAPAAAATRRTVLLVDDEPLVAKAIARMLGAAEVEVATSGPEALARGPLTRFDVILCDLMMPEMTGIELYERAVAATPTVAGRFVFLTGGVFTDEARAFLDAPGRRWPTKPARRDELAAALDAVVTATAAA